MLKNNFVKSATVTLPNDEDSLKFFLYLREKEIRLINKILGKVMQTSAVERKVWIKDYGKMMDSALNIFNSRISQLLYEKVHEQDILDLFSLVSSLLNKAMDMMDHIYEKDTHLVG